ncbi:MAG: DUF4198 domain-containing protein [Pseudomonadota bacterium]
MAWAKRLVGALAALVLTAGAAGAHEFWIEADDYTIAPGEPLVANLRVGQQFRGSRLGYLPDRFRRFEIISPNGSVPITSRLGDAPAINQALEEAGPHIVVHVTTDSTLTYDALEDFAAFTAAHGLDEKVTEHAARGLPNEGFGEAYSRSVKALVDVGGTTEGPRDRALGLPIELVVEGDPYADPRPESVTVAALYQGAPIPNALISIFIKDMATPDAEATQTDIVADASGRVVVPLEEGLRYLLNVVVLREPSQELAEAEGVVWESLWGSTTFETD